ncbi:spore cortex biosynthesis protein YabQ [Pseudoflavonifractor sp. MSJ-37]|uniref:spore cortex biosynthesis protein YabQ n=1 Tax=Pseudoflavonifractor sp. MSJ-37 TaxID=2841531 RepID=UPI0020A0255F|nr:spore cortex biosynthesis protein YabQ [Pseudoflavonifractor sp. MSJ-37]
MAVSIPGQLMALAAALLLGGAVGLLYDCFRVLRCRVRWPLLGGLLDLLFWLCVTLALFLHALETGGGVLRFYMVAALFGGCACYFWVLSPFFLFLGYRLADLAAFLLRLAALPPETFLRILKKTALVGKKGFSYGRKWYKIKSHIRHMENTGPQADPDRRGGGTDEDEASRVPDQAGHPLSAGGHRHRPAGYAQPDPERRGGEGPVDRRP